MSDEKAFISGADLASSARGMQVFYGVVHEGTISWIPLFKMGVYQKNFRCHYFPTECLVIAGGGDFYFRSLSNPCFVDSEKNCLLPKNNLAPLIKSFQEIDTRYRHTRGEGVGRLRTYTYIQSCVQSIQFPQMNENGRNVFLTSGVNCFAFPVDSYALRSEFSHWSESIRKTQYLDNNVFWFLWRRKKTTIKLKMPIFNFILISMKNYRHFMIGMAVKAIFCATSDAISVIEPCHLKSRRRENFVFCGTPTHPPLPSPRSCL